ncbi:hypothetical protein K1T71_013278 [Dendrolimus kikuchii]|uniref:Uncharacterized protein n=1 Tax=Dendrolimus kikuchii TaxID=765133 RepID=A0ACC1CHM5_9NEOP|nr:hypothetical protein K1T71_013278 [Dendrolimus kikuchii]
MDSSEVHKPVPKGKPEGKHRGKVDTAIPTTAATSSKEVARTGPLEPLQGTKGSATTGPSILQLKWGQANTPVHGAAKPTVKAGKQPSGPACDDPRPTRKHKRMLKKKEKRRAKRAEAKSAKQSPPPHLQTDKQTEAPAPTKVLPSTSKEQGPSRPGPKTQGTGQAKPNTKRARLDETVSPRGESKKPKLSPAMVPKPISYAEAASKDVPKAELVITSSTSFISQATAAEIEKLLTERIITSAKTQAPTSEAPRFMRRPTYVDGSLRLYCDNEAAVEWTKETCAALELPEVGKLVVTDVKNIPKLVRCGILLPHEHDGDKVLIGTMLQWGNPWAQVERWRVHAILPQTRATFVVVSIPKDLVPVVLARKRRLSYRLGAVYLKFQGPKGRFVDTPADLLDETAGVQAAADVPMSEVTPPLEQKETMQVGSSRAVEASSDDELLDLSRLGLEEEGDPNGSPFLQ